MSRFARWMPGSAGQGPSRIKKELLKARQILRDAILSQMLVLRFKLLVESVIPEVTNLLALQCPRFQTYSKRSWTDMTKRDVWFRLLTPVCKTRYKEDRRHVAIDGTTTVYPFRTIPRFADDKDDSLLPCLPNTRANRHVSSQLFSRRAPGLQNVLQAPINQFFSHMNFTRGSHRKSLLDDCYRLWSCLQSWRSLTISRLQFFGYEQQKVLTVVRSLHRQRRF